jgi:hypothetical protein
MPYLSIYNIKAANSTYRNSLTIYHIHYYFTSVFLFLIFGTLFYLYSLMRGYRNTGTTCYKCTRNKTHLDNNANFKTVFRM